MSTDAQTHTLLLSQSYEPIRVISWQRALTLFTLGKVEVIEEYDRDIRSCFLVFKMPAVVRLLNAFRRHRHPVRFSRVNVFARDRYRCQYCGQRGNIKDLTFDHVVPRSLGGITAWDNVVAACIPCNRQKANRTPGQAGMRLRRPPEQPTWVPAVTLTISMTSVPDAWRDYLYWTGTLDTSG